MPPSGRARMILLAITISSTSNPMPLRSKKKARPAGAKENPRIRWRNQGGTLRAYAELRDFGGGQPALIPEGETRATTDPEVAEALLLTLMSELAEERKTRALLGLDPDADLAEFSVYHLEEKAATGEYQQRWLDKSETYLARAVAFFTRYQRATEKDPEPDPCPRNLATIGVPDIRLYHEWLKTQPNNRGGQLGRQSRRHHLNVLSGVFRRAISEGKLPPGSNPVAALMDKPKVPKSETSWLEVDELALLLESARIVVEQDRASGRRPPLPCAYEFLATFILTGAREDEIRRLQIRHLDFDAEIIDIPGTKTEGSNRSMPMHPQLREILLPYVESLRRTSGPVFLTAAGQPVGDWRKTLDVIATRAGFAKGRIRTRVFRTSYITHRLACIDQGAPIDPYQVAREVGHASLAMIMKVYGRVQRRRVRMEELAFRVDCIGPALQDRLQALSAPPPPRERPGVKEAAALVGRFVEATSEMSNAEVEAVTGIPVPTVRRLRGGQQPTVQGRTRDRIVAFLNRLAEK